MLFTYVSHSITGLIYVQKMQFGITTSDFFLVLFRPRVFPIVLNSAFLLIFSKNSVLIYIINQRVILALHRWREK